MSKLALVILLFFPGISSAYNFTLHMTVAQLAYDELEKPVQVFWDSRAHELLNRLPTEVSSVIEKISINNPDLVKISFLADLVSKKTLEKLFEEYQIIFPEAFNDFKLENTKQWHYWDQVYPTDRNCKIIEKQNLHLAYQYLEIAMKESSTIEQQGILLAFIIHLLSDAHQPLHGASKYTSDCKHDKGGNLTCLEMKGRKCIENLHQFWDSGAGFTQKNKSPNQSAKTLSKMYPKEIFGERILDISSQEWMREDLALSEFVYSIDKYSQTKKSYKEKALSMSESRAALAGYRLSTLLKKRYDEKMK